MVAVPVWPTWRRGAVVVGSGGGGRWWWRSGGVRGSEGGQEADYTSTACYSTTAQPGR